MQAPVSRIAPMVALLFSVFLITSCGSDDTEQAREPAVRPVKMITLSSASDARIAKYPAVIDANTFSDSSFQVPGLIEEVAVVNAQQVEQGDLIARLDQRDYKSQLASASSQFNNAEDEYQRAVRLYEQDAIARSVLEQRQSQRDVAKAQLDTAEKALADTVLRAPFAGVVVQVPVRERQTVSAGEVVASVMGRGKLEANFDVPASVVARAQETEIQASFVILDAAPKDKITASFKEANLLADSASQTYKVTYTFEPPKNLVVLPGMNATVEIISKSKSEAAETQRISVPLSAIASDGESKYVWVVDQETMTVSRRNITVLDGIGEMAVVTEGLALDETIAAAGASFLADGMQVRPWIE
ncbi:MAG: efflux RND transporter periplasmic adaptor subunit [Gammaproteobacteria bacterium]|nr:efflux RND transporter periplasmic adaptor subunit [Gammaproteobacteria bacterium]